MKMDRRIAEGSIRRLFRLIGKIPPAWGERIGRIWYRLDKKHRQIALRNLTRAFGHERSEEEIGRLAEKTFEKIARIPFEVGGSLTLTPKRFNRHFRVRGLSHVENAYAQGRGVLLLSGHVGCWELMPIVFGMTAGYPSAVIYRPLDFDPLNRFFLDLRARYGAEMIPKAHSMRRVLRLLKEKALVGVLLDQNVDWYDGVFVDFFGHRACTNKGLALLAIKTRAPVIPVFLVREEGKYLAIFEPEIPLISTGDRTKDIEENTLAYNRALESIIERYPDQWFWVHQRWKTRPYQPWPRVIRPKRKKKKRKKKPIS